MVDGRWVGWVDGRWVGWVDGRWWTVGGRDGGGWDGWWDGGGLWDGWKEKIGWKEIGSECVAGGVEGYGGPKEEWDENERGGGVQEVPLLVSVLIPKPVVRGVCVGMLLISQDTSLDQGWMHPSLISL